MAGKSKVEVVVNKLRWAIVRGEFVDEYMPHEEEMAEGFEVSRTTLRSALTFLRAEGLVDSVPGVAWRAKKSLNAGSFESLTRLLEDMELEQRRLAVLAMLDHRIELVIGIVSALVLEHGTVAPQVHAAIERLEPPADEPEPFTIEVLALEDEFFTALIENHGNVSKRIGALQLQRALAVARAWLNPMCRLAPMHSQARALAELIDNHEPGAVDCAYALATLRKSLYSRLLAARVPGFQGGNTIAEASVG